MTKTSAFNDEIKDLGFEGYSATWGSEPTYDHAPQKKGDGCMFYNFNEEGHNEEFLKKFIPAIDRCILMVEKDKTAYEKAEKRRHIKNLKLLKKECQKRLRNLIDKNYDKEIERRLRDKTCPGHTAETDCEIDPSNPCDACNEAEDKKLEEDRDRRRGLYGPEYEGENF